MKTAAVGMACLIIVFVAAPALAKDSFLERLRKMYGTPRAINNCQMCHHPDKAKDEEPDQTNLNDFGKDLANLPLMKPLIEAEHDHEYTVKEWEKFEQAVRSIENEDSDKDGATNREELSLGTYPGEKSSTPASDALKAFREKAAEKK
ncbi:MAG TPA: hypothetical protein VEJ63_19065 [Planctomycetota bacterium]|nr:hypothetical protein [Planctomycetota bacterium]